ncbi:MAG: cyclase family protein [Pseudomonadota bacterium]
MRVIDLTLPMHADMDVYPGDPPPRYDLIEVFAETGWNMKRLEMNGHDGTHVNVPLHATADGKNLDDYDLSAFVGEAVLYESDDDITPDMGLIFHATDISWPTAQAIVDIGPRFIGLPARFEFDIAIERWLLERDVVSFERLINTDQLPKTFFFHGAPLKIVHGDGSPVRAYALVD